MEECFAGTFEFWSTASVDGARRECFPHDRFADVGGDEELDTRAEAVTILEEFVKDGDDEGCRYGSDDEEKTDASTKIRWYIVQAGENIDFGLT